MTVNEILNAILKGIVIVLVGIVFFKPEVLGHWEAQRDIAYDSIWSEWVSDCDCGQTLE